MKIKILMVSSLLGIILLYSACAPTVTPVPSVTPYQTEERTLSPTAILTATRPNTPEPSIIHSPTATITRPPALVPTSTVTELPQISTLIAEGTLSPEKAKKVVEELYRTNAGCKYPCWWGITPGDTTWTQAERFLNRLTNDVNSIKPGGELYYRVKDNIVQSIWVINSHRLLKHTVPSVLSEYGIPGEIWVSGYYEGRFMGYRFWLTILYPKLGVLFEYGYFSNFYVDDEIALCHKNDSLNSLYLFQPNQPIPRNDFEKIATWEGGAPLIRMLEATGIGEKEFYEKFSKSNFSCFRTPKKLWDITP